MATAQKTRKTELEELRRISNELRGDILRMLHGAGSGHPGGSLSLIDLLTVLYWDFLRYDPKRPSDPERDRFVLSKGHCVPALYAVWAKRGYLPKDELGTLRKLGSRLQGHPDRTRLPFVEVSTGSLGQGLSVALGFALSAKLDKSPRRVWCVTGDGELQQGQVWEAAMAAPRHQADNLTWIVDYNQVQQEGLVKDQMSLEPLADKLKAFNWHVQQIDGHDFGQIRKALEEAGKVKGRPQAIVSTTKKGKGVSFMELSPDWHGKAPKADELKKALDELDKGGKR